MSKEEPGSDTVSVPGAFTQGLLSLALPLLHLQSPLDLQFSSGSCLPPLWGPKEPLS